MCCEMAANGVQDKHESPPENLRKQLAVAVRSVQWSYAIFWSLSTTKHGVLEWGDGYYNGDIKTRKTVQAVELPADKVGLQRSEQLRELFESLAEDETDQQAKRSSSALSPEDLTDLEWYYLVCMSFVFSPGEGLPGRALANSQTIWLCDAQHADSKVFSRSLLAKSASIQTVVCFPHLGGVIELGVTELVVEDPSLLQHIKTSLLEFSKPICFGKNPPSFNEDDDKGPMCIKVDHEIIIDTVTMDNLYSPAEEIKFDEEGNREVHGNIHDESNMDSLDECSNGCEHNNQTEESFMLEDINAGASQVQSWHFIDDDFSNGVQDSMHSSDCISKAFVSQEQTLCYSKSENVKQLHLKELQDCNHTKLGSLDIRECDDLHYIKILSAILRSSHELIKIPSFHNYDCKTSFVSWKNGGNVGNRFPVHQKLLKNILFNVPLMHGSSLKSGKEKGGEDCPAKVESDETFLGNIFSEKKRENEKYLILKSLVPSVSEIDKASILNDAIKYLKELEARVEELESCMYSGELEAGDRRKSTEINEQISDNMKKPSVNKRKARDIDETDWEFNRIVSKDGVPPVDVKVSLKGQDVLIEMKCSYREYLLLDIMDAINNLHLDAHSVQSSTLDGVLSLTLGAKFRGAAVAPAGMIQQALVKITWQ